MGSGENPNSSIEMATLSSDAESRNDWTAQDGSQPSGSKHAQSANLSWDAARLDPHSRASQLVPGCLCRYGLGWVPTVVPGHYPANQNCRIAGMAHFMVNQRRLVFRLRDGHETCCT